MEHDTLESRAERGYVDAEPGYARTTHEGDTLQESAHQLARGLGWFSIGLGLAELTVPDALARLIGARPHTALVRAYGARELAAGIGLLSGRGTSGWMWSRVTGDLLDLGTLWLAAEERGADRGRLGLATAAVAGVTLLDLAVAGYLSQSEAGESGEASYPIEGEVLNEPAFDMPVT
jgi:hypothetical protein